MKNAKDILGRYQAMIDICKEYYQKKCELDDVQKQFDKIKSEA